MTALRLTETPQSSDAIARAKRAFRAWIATLDSGTGPNRYAAQDAWIERYILERGAEALITEKVRTADFALIRDRARREWCANGDFVSSRVTMSARSWLKLRALRQALGVKSLGDAISAIIMDGQNPNRPKAFAE